jgi:hypothetical protein
VCVCVCNVCVCGIVFLDVTNADESAWGKHAWVAVIIRDT